MGAAAAAFILILALVAAGAGKGKDQADEADDFPSPPPPPGDEEDDVLEDLDDDGLLDLACVVWLARGPADSDTALALRLLRGLFPGMTFPGLPGGARERAQARLEAMFGDLRGGLVQCDSPISPEGDPRAGGYYQIKRGDSPLAIVRVAYGLSGDSQAAREARMRAVRAVTRHPRNGGGVIGSGIVVGTTKAQNAALVGPELFSMNARWRCEPRFESERFESGGCFAVVYLPELVLS